MHSRIDVSWDRVSVADRYELRRSRDGGSYGPAFDPRSDTSHEDRGLDPETEYCYQVRAVGNGVESLWSGPECDTTGSEPEVMCPTPAAPTISTSLSGRTITVSWNGVSVEAGCTVSYRVFRDSSEIANTTSTSYADAGLSAGNYCYEVSAESSPGGSESAVSGSACETVPAVPPTNFAAAAASSSSVRLTWIAGERCGQLRGSVPEDARELGGLAGRGSGDGPYGGGSGGGHGVRVRDPDGGRDRDLDGAFGDGADAAEWRPRSGSRPPTSLRWRLARR